MTDPEKTTTPAKKAATRLQHVAAHRDQSSPNTSWLDVRIFGQKVDALEFIVDQDLSSDWQYVALEHGKSVAEALKATP